MCDGRCDDRDRDPAGRSGSDLSRCAGRQPAAGQGRPIGRLPETARPGGDRGRGGVSLRIASARADRRRLFRSERGPLRAGCLAAGADACSRRPRVRAGGSHQGPRFDGGPRPAAPRLAEPRDARRTGLPGAVAVWGDPSGRARERDHRRRGAGRRIAGGQGSPRGDDGGRPRAGSPRRLGRARPGSVAFLAPHVPSGAADAGPVREHRGGGRDASRCNGARLQARRRPGSGAQGRD